MTITPDGALILLGSLEHVAVVNIETIN